MNKERVGLNLIGNLTEWYILEGRKSGDLRNDELTGTTPVAEMMPSSCATVKLETPIARTYREIELSFD